MTAFIVSYDLHKQGQNYDCLTKKLQAYPRYWRMQKSVWLISSAQTAAEIRNALLACLDTNDTLFVGELSSAAWYGFTQAGDDWIKSIF